MSRRTTLPASILAGSLTLSLLACVSSPDDASSLAPCEGKCDGVATAALDAKRPGEAAVLRLHADAARDGRIDGAEAQALVAFLKDAQGRNQRIASFLTALVETETRLDADALDLITTALDPAGRVEVPLDNEVYRLVVGPSSFLEDDTLYLKAVGRVAAHTGITSHSRGYAAKRDGVLFTRHGSLAPQHPMTSDDARTTLLRSQGPDAALDSAALVDGLRLSSFTTFGATARSPAYFDPSPNTPSWAGICQGWTHNALDNRLNVLVDPPGGAGARGLWIYGQWLSRADLGNAMMGASFSLGIADSTTIDSFVRPEKLVKALGQHVLRTGRGLRVDIWNDVHNSSGRYNPQIWNQPIVGASVEVIAVSAATRDAVVTFARGDRTRFEPLPAVAGVSLVRARASWGAETDDAWEQEARFRDSEWNLYMVTDVDGRVVRGYTAYDLVAAGVTALPVKRSDGLPDYLAIPRHELTDAAFAGTQHRLLEPHNTDGARFRFVVGTVLAYGIPEPTRAAFEAEVRAGVVDVVDLRARFPGIANAYSPEEWRRVFEPKLGTGASFGARWTLR